MIRKNVKLYSLALIIADTLVLLTAFSIAYIVRVQFDPRPLLASVYAADYFQAFLFIVPFWIIIFASMGLYESNTYNRRLVSWAKLAIGSLIGILLVIGWQYISDKSILPARLVAVYGLAGAYILLVFEREAFRFIRTYLFRCGRGLSRVLLIGSSKATSDIARSLSDTVKSGYIIVAIAGPKSIIPKGLKTKHYSSIEAALKNINNDDITTIIQTDFSDMTSLNQKVLEIAQSNHLNYSFIPGESEFYSGKNTVDVFLGYPMISVYQTPLIGWGSIEKRIFDLFFGSIAMIVLSPIFLGVIIMQLILNPGPIFYKSKRLTRYSKFFDMYKFRSMSSKYGSKDAATEFREMGREDLAKEYERDFKVENDPRITKFGKFLRATSIDELPQLINVLKGDLSLVGPRPIPKKELDAKFTQKHGALLLSVKSGMTGLWQVSGRSDLSTEERNQIELFYVQNWSFWLDIKIMIKTVLVVLKKAGAK